MIRAIVICAAVVLGAAVVGAQQELPSDIGSPEFTPLINDVVPLPSPLPQLKRFEIVASDKALILLDNADGRTWILKQDENSVEKCGWRRIPQLEEKPEIAGEDNAVFNPPDSRAPAEK